MAGWLSYTPCRTAGEPTRPPPGRRPADHQFRRPIHVLDKLCAARERSCSPHCTSRTGPTTPLSSHTHRFADSKWDRIELSDDEDNFHPNIDNNLMIRLQREKRQQREAEDEEKRKKLEEDNTDAAKAELDRMERTKKLNVGNICTDKFASTHEKSTASESANPTKGKKDAKLQVAASNQETFVEGYEEFLQEHRPLLLEYAAIDEQDEISEQFILTNTQLLSEHATGFCEPRHWNFPRLPPPSAERPANHSAPQTCCTASTCRPRARLGR